MINPAILEKAAKEAFPLMGIVPEATLVVFADGSWFVESAAPDGFSIAEAPAGIAYESPEALAAALGEMVENDDG